MSIWKLQMGKISETNTNLISSVPDLISYYKEEIKFCEERMLDNAKHCEFDTAQKWKVRQASYRKFVSQLNLIND